MGKGGRKEKTNPEYLGPFFGVGEIWEVFFVFFSSVKWRVGWFGSMRERYER